MFLQLETELARLRDDQELLQEKSTKDHEAIQTLENLLSSCRQETLNQKVANQETQKEIRNMYGINFNSFVCSVIMN